MTHSHLRLGDGTPEPVQHHQDQQPQRKRHHGSSSSRRGGSDSSKRDSSSRKNSKTNKNRAAAAASAASASSSSPSSSSSSSFEMPADILGALFMFLPLAALCSSASGVCRQWELSSRPWRGCSLHYGGMERFVTVASGQFVSRRVRAVAQSLVAHSQSRSKRRHASSGGSSSVDLIPPAADELWLEDRKGAVALVVEPGGVYLVRTSAAPQLTLASFAWLVPKVPLLGASSCAPSPDPPPVIPRTPYAGTPIRSCYITEVA